MKIDKEWLSQSLEESEKIQLKANLSFNELDNLNVDTTLYYYINTLGNKILCRIICFRENNNVVVKN